MKRLTLKAVNPKPILKWAGGKQAIANQIIRHFPEDFNRYYEPFIGGASIVLGLEPEQGIIGDENRWLIDTYKAIRDDWQAVAAELDEMLNTKEEYLRIRAINPQSLPPTKRAAQLVYLNKTCFRGLFRVNKKGDFNVPYGDYDRRYYSPENFESVSKAFQHLEFLQGDFENTLAGIQPGDFAYLDPPYYKLGGHADFNRYTAGQFGEKEQIRLAAFCRELDNRGIQWVLSNSKTPFIAYLYRGFRIVEVSARREINLKSANRNVTELLILNY